jgi:protein-disulfide isomerase
MSEARKGRGRKGGRPESGSAGPAPNPGRGGSASPVGWILSANLLAVLAVVLAVVALVLHFTEEDEDGGQAVAQPSPTVQPTVVVQATPTPAVVDVSVDDDPFIGPEDAPVTIVDFDDYQ